MSSVQNQRTTEYVYFVFEKWYGKDFEFCVRFHAKDHIIFCDCKKYSEVGIPCYHAFQIYNVHYVRQIHDKCI